MTSGTKPDEKSPRPFRGPYEIKQSEIFNGEEILWSLFGGDENIANFATRAECEQIKLGLELEAHLGEILAELDAGITAGSRELAARLRALRGEG